MTNWYPTIKTIKGHRYLYRQRTWREGGRVRSQTQYIGPIDISAASGVAQLRRSRRDRGSELNQLAMAVFGVEDEYGQRVNSLWNRTINKEPKRVATEPEPEKVKPAEAGKLEINDGGVIPAGVARHTKDVANGWLLENARRLQRSAPACPNAPQCYIKNIPLSFPRIAA